MKLTRHLGPAVRSVLALAVEGLYVLVLASCAASGWVTWSTLRGVLLVSAVLLTAWFWRTSPRQRERRRLKRHPRRRWPM